MSTTRESVEAALKSMEEPAETEADEAVAESAAPEVAAPVVEEAPSPEPEDREDGRDNLGRFKPKQAEEAKTVEQVAAVKPKASPVQTTTVAPVAATPLPLAPKGPQAPGRWTPAAREKWASIPPEIQQEVVKRERETSMLLQKAAEERKSIQAMRDVMAPFEGPIRARGGDPLKMVGASLQMVHRLQYGNAAERATLMAGLIKQFDVPIEPLAKALDGQPAASAARDINPAALKEEIRRELLQEFKGQRDQAVQNRYLTEYEKALGDPKFEFMAGDDDQSLAIRRRMAAWIEVEAAEGVDLSLEDAYRRACQENPEVAGILKQREDAKAATAKQAAAQRATRAAGPKPAPIVRGNGTEKPRTTKEAAEQAWQKLESRQRGT